MRGDARLLCSTMYCTCVTVSGAGVDINRQDRDASLMYTVSQKDVVSCGKPEIVLYRANVRVFVGCTPYRHNCPKSLVLED